ncbi:DUF29 domain-containing protein [Endozoicomonas sp. ALB032]|uniref:DUF29 domain-containing protein n=1 Tax=Endozoicomonas sp. ALB032 TaxID=3403082 RepID=UPI003BB607CB
MENLYETDYTQWLGQQRELLAQGQFDQLDVPNLLEAIDIQMGNIADELGSHLIILLVHLLKYDYQKQVLKDPWVKDKVIHTWMPSINNSRTRIGRHIQKNPCLQPKVNDLLAEVYPHAKKDAIKQMNHYIRTEASRLNKDSFPEQCPWTFEQITDDDWLPGD